MLAYRPLDHLTMLLMPEPAAPSDDAAARVELTAPLFVTVDYHFDPGTPDTLYRPNGDPGDPGEPDELILYTVVSRTVITLAGDGVTVHIAPGINLLPFMSLQDVEDFELDLLRDMPYPDDDPDDGDDQ